MERGIWLFPLLFALYPFCGLERIGSTLLLSSPLSGDELQFNCWTLVSVAVAVKGR